MKLAYAENYIIVPINLIRCNLKVSFNARVRVLILVLSEM